MRVILTFYTRVLGHLTSSFIPLSSVHSLSIVDHMYYISSVANVFPVFQSFPSRCLSTTVLFVFSIFLSHIFRLFMVFILPTYLYQNTQTRIRINAWRKRRLDELLTTMSPFKSNIPLSWPNIDFEFFLYDNT